MQEIKLSQVEHMKNIGQIDISQIANSDAIRAEIERIQQEAVAKAIDNLVQKTIVKLSSADLLSMLSLPAFQDTNNGAIITKKTRDYIEKLAALNKKQQNLKEKFAKLHAEILNLTVSNFSEAYPTDEMKVQALSLIQLPKEKKEKRTYTKRQKIEPVEINVEEDASEATEI